MRGGQNRKPTSLKIVTGTFRPHREKVPGATLARQAVPTPPKTLSSSERAAWTELARQVEELKVYTAADYTSFRLLVKVVAQCDDADAEMPATAFVRLLQVASSLLQRFGLDPASHGRVAPAAVETTPAEDPTAEFGA